ncbi:MAG: DMT family transporter, partial [Bacteroidota bacterium]
TTSPTKPNLASWLMLLGLSLIWGGSYLLIKYSLVAFSPTQVASLRMSLTALAFLPIFIWQVRRIDWSLWKQLAIVGFSGSFIPSILFATAQTKISSSLAGILSSLTPLFTFLLGILFFGVKAAWVKLAGVFIGLAGAVWLVVIDRGIDDLEGMRYGLLVLAGCLFYGFSNNVVKAHLHSTPSLVISTVSYLFVGIPGAIYLAVSGFLEVIQTHEKAWQSLGYISILAFVGTVICSVIFFKLIKNTSALFAASVSYLIPVIALWWGMFDGETVTVWHLAGMATILTGVYLASR